MAGRSKVPRAVAHSEGVARAAAGSDRGLPAIAILHDTKKNAPMVAKPGLLSGLIENTTGNAAQMVPVAGVLTRTTQGAEHRDAGAAYAERVGASVEKSHEPVGKTQPMRYGQVPFAGRKF
jgi:hypothetical protein